MRVILKCHSKVINSADYIELSQKRNFRIPVSSTNSVFAQRFSSFLHPFIYNKISTKFPLQDYSTREVKLKVQSWLNSLPYEDIEKILEIVK
jgi:hypothetical protein